jgi:hypothetical protein
VTSERRVVSTLVKVAVTAALYAAIVYRIDLTTIWARL